jgi:hypothetical protein
METEVFIKDKSIDRKTLVLGCQSTLIYTTGASTSMTDRVRVSHMLDQLVLAKKPMESVLCIDGVVESNEDLFLQQRTEPERKEVIN